ncbi:MAG: ABC transporter permease [Proteobacteria bacterium]|nr:ABC transporter permease [Pseudomonadota bacterium]
MNLARIKAIFLRQLFLFKSNPTRLAGIFLWLVIDIVQWGFISKYLGSLGKDTFSFITVILGAIILWEFATRIQQGIMMAFLEDIWTQNFLNFFASPLTILEYLGGLVLTSITTGMAGFGTIACIAGMFFGYNVLKIGLLLLPFMLILLIFAVAMGVFVSAMIFRLGPSAEWLGWPIPLIISIFAGVYYPVSTLPESIRGIARIIPPAYVFESLRRVLYPGVLGDKFMPDLLVGTVLALLYLVAASFYFVKVYQRNLITGSIARFNAESL